MYGASNAEYVRLIGPWTTFLHFNASETISFDALNERNLLELEQSLYNKQSTLSLTL